MEQPKVSVIMPVYNTREYVREAVESILSQTLQEIEVIIINDGSTDGSYEELQTLAQEDKRIHLYDQDNQGQSVARNNAIDLSAGKYFYFMDSDDRLEPDALEMCYNKCEAYTLDFVFFNADILNKNDFKNMTMSYNHGNLDEFYVGRGLVVLDNQLRDRHFTPSPCLLFIRSAFMVQHNLRFHPGIIHEDQLFTVRLYLEAQRVMYIRRHFFLRRLRSDSTMTTRFSWRNISGYLTVADELIAYRDKRQEFALTSVVNRHLRQMLDAAIWQAHVMPFRQRVRLFLTVNMKYKQFVSSRNLSVLLVKALLKRHK